MRCTVIELKATWRRAPLKTKMAGRQRCRPANVMTGFRLMPLAQVEYLNSGIAFSSSLDALNTAWSGYQGLGFAMVAAVLLVVAAPVVVGNAGRLAAAFGEPAAPVEATPV